MTSLKVVGLGGGIGASRLWKALLARGGEIDLTLAVNTGEDLWIHGLRVCPDLDTVLYALSGRQDSERGWGVRDETWRCMETLGEIEGRQWFNLGDRDLAVHLYRTGRLRAGHTLSEITSDLARRLGLGCRILPATDAEITTRVVTSGGRDLHYQEFLVREQATADVTDTYIRGPALAAPAAGLLAHIASADLIIIGPSNPVASLGPILHLTGVREALKTARHRTVVVTPIVASVPITDPGENTRARSRARLLAAAGFAADPAGVAAFYTDVASTFLLDRADLPQLPAVEKQGLRAVPTDTLLHQGADPAPLITALLARR
ncbi:2-phospho-L-lactate transferase CofD family protein [Streptomyces sporangiiformans]|uniref:2-phospho-L-lactate transferase n=1 Tax=Streptomyces sporangiiformans TaxID=2315329 RepID=A0A505DNT5_9ACTN|nr:2-phospho-L-lactate transferase CofD family protein [Streptomyces sporangiiformans]TPQ22899.1 2-phospho-L-lactate transferase [Streptomyces sporangiiformans]